jgi:PEP-CTERM motif
MRIFNLAILAAVAPLIVSAASVDFSSSSDSNDTVSFNESNPGTLTLGSNNCSFFINPTCTLTGSQNIGGTIYTFTFTQPNQSKSPFSYNGEPSTITTSGSPVLDFTISDNHGDSASGTYDLTNLLSDGSNGVDIDGGISIGSITSGSKISTFDSLFGLPSSTQLAFVLDVGNCTAGRRSVNCIQTTDPTAQFLSLDITPGTPVSGVPEPGTFGLLGVASSAVVIAVRRRRSEKS